jgi:hypothetical protein
MTKFGIPVSVGKLHGVPIAIGKEKSICMPVGDAEGTWGPSLVIPPDFDCRELFDTVCRIRGEFDLSRALRGHPPFNWGEPGLWLNVHGVIAEIKSQAAE